MHGKAGQEATACAIIEQVVVQWLKSMGMVVTPLAATDDPEASEPMCFSSAVEFNGTGCVGCLRLSCAAGVVPVECHTDALRRNWISDCTGQLMRRVKNRLRQFGVCVESGPVELIFDRAELQHESGEFANGVTRAFSTSGGKVRVQLDLAIDVELVTSADPVPFRDEGDIILF